MASTTNNFTIRNFRKSDAVKVRELYVWAMATGRKSATSGSRCLFSRAPRIAKSPCRIALRRLLFHPRSYIYYALFIFGLVLATHSQNRKVWGAFLSIGVAVLFFGYRFILSRAFIKYCEGCLQDDLADIIGHYKLRPIRPNDEELVPSSPSGFWVVERKCPDEGCIELVGCVGLGMILWLSHKGTEKLPYRLPNERRHPSG